MRNCPIPTGCQSLSSLLHEGLSSTQKTVLRFLPNGNVDDPLNQSFGGQELDQQALNVAAILREKCKPGDRVLLLYPQGPDFVIAFLACLYAGVIAVPVAPPFISDSMEGRRRIARIVQDCCPTFVMTTNAFAEKVAPVLGDLPGHYRESWFYSDQVKEAGSVTPSSVNPAQIAFLQYTSGSTGEPKGVMVSHGNLLTNLHCIQQITGNCDTPNAVSWLPQFHDMGLIGAILFPLSRGGQITLMSPQSFIRHPMRWITALSHYRANMTVSANFGMELVLRVASETRCRGLDLSSLEYFFIGAEPVRAQTLRRFASVFRPYGLRTSAFVPTYGMAEATLIVSASSARQEPLIIDIQNTALQEGELQAVPGGDRAMVGCGAPLEDLAIVDPETRQQLPPGRIGEIWLRGDSNAQGYWGNPERTREVFQAKLDDQGPYLRTGDLGALHNSQLFITGRCKDLIIVRGRNLFPQDIEVTVEEAGAKAIRQGRAVAVSLEVDDEEHLGVLFEVAPSNCPKQLDDLLADVARAVVLQHGIEPCCVVALAPHNVAMTTSGKIRRQETRRRFVEGNLTILARWLQTTNRQEAVPTPSKETSSTAAPSFAFVLSSERAGSTLLRIILSAHSRLFSPPELNLLPYRTLAERRRALPPGQEDGLLRAVVELTGCTTRTAEHLVGDWEENGLDPLDVLARLQQQASARMLVDKSPINSKFPAGLQRAAERFGESARYIHLVRHPYAMIDSYTRLGLQRLLRDALPTRISPHEAGEISWLESNRNIQEFLSSIRPEQHCVVRYEDLVTSPEEVLRKLCEFLNITFDPAMLNPYQHGRMTDKLRIDSLDGDPNFFRHSAVDAQLGSIWKEIRLPQHLGPESCRVARSFSYVLPVEDQVLNEPLAVENVDAIRQAKQSIRSVLAKSVSLPEHAVPEDASFFSFGMDSLKLVILTQELEEKLGYPIESQSIFNYPTINKLARHLSEKIKPKDEHVVHHDQGKLYHPFPKSLTDNDLPANYQFDMEKDIPWKRIEEPGVYVPPALLSQIGIDVDALHKVDGAYDMFQWAAALGICTSLEMTEWGIIDFCVREGQILGSTPRLHSLVEEEEKHIQMFRRYARYLRTLHPQLTTEFDECVKRSYKAIARMFNPEISKHLHYQVWINTLFGETFTLYLQRMLSSSKEAIQPTWFSVHQAHAREEAHHIVTGNRYAESLALTDQQKSTLSETFLQLVNDEVLHIIGIAPALEIVENNFGVDCLRKRPLRLADMQLFDVLQRSGSFRMIRQHAPALSDLRCTVRTDACSGYEDDVSASGKLLALAMDAALSPDIAPRPGQPAGDSQQILLTGATGFLGAYLLHNFMRQSDARITCLVRCKDTEDGLRRLHDNLTAYGLPTENLSTRVEVVPGDLQQDQLGLPPEKFLQLARKIGIIFHNGAVVNFIKPYPELRAVNVGATHELLRLAVSEKLKKIYYVSSLASTPLNKSSMREEEDLGAASSVAGGYGQSKWVAETMLQEARKRGIPVKIYRPGRITGDSHSGAWNRHDLLTLLMQVCVELGKAPDIRTLTDLTPVDYVADAMVKLTIAEEDSGLIYHIINPELMELREAWRHLQSLGYPLQVCPYAEWRAELMGAKGNNVALLNRILTEVAPESVDGGSIPIRRLDGLWTQKILRELQVDSPPTNEKLLHKYINAMRQAQVLPSLPPSMNHTIN